MLLVLTGITAISVALLAFVNELTKGPIAEANMNTLNTALSEVLPSFDNSPVDESDTIYSEKNGKKMIDFIIYPAKNDGKWVGSAVQATSLGFGGELKVLVGFDANGQIYNYSLLSHVETPGLGSKADVWFKEGQRGNIIGMSPGQTVLRVKGDQDGTIDAITASTITTKAFLNAVNAAYQAFMTGESDGTTGATQKSVEPADAISE